MPIFAKRGAYRYLLAHAHTGQTTAGGSPSTTRREVLIELQYSGRGGQVGQVSTTKCCAHFIMIVMSGRLSAYTIRTPLSKNINILVLIEVRLSVTNMGDATWRDQIPKQEQITRSNNRPGGPTRRSVHACRANLAPIDPHAVLRPARPRQEGPIVSRLT